MVDSVVVVVQAVVALRWLAVVAVSALPVVLSAFVAVVVVAVMVVVVVVAALPSVSAVALASSALAAAWLVALCQSLALVVAVVELLPPPPPPPLLVFAVTAGVLSACRPCLEAVAVAPLPLDEASASALVATRAALCRVCSSRLLNWRHRDKQQ